GQLAGQKGTYTDLLRALLKRHRPAGEEEDWPTFAGSPSRQRLLVAAPPWGSERGPVWRVPLPALEKADELAEPRRVRRCPVHPVIADRFVFVADGRRVTAHDLGTGRVLFRYDLLADLDPDGKKGLAALGSGNAASCTPTIADGRIHTRLGAAPGRVVCVDLP